MIIPASLQLIQDGRRSRQAGSVRIVIVQDDATHGHNDFGMPVHEAFIDFRATNVLRNVVPIWHIGPVERIRGHRHSRLEARQGQLAVVQPHLSIKLEAPVLARSQHIMSERRALCGLQEQPHELTLQVIFQALIINPAPVDEKPMPDEAIYGLLEMPFGEQHVERVLAKDVCGAAAGSDTIQERVHGLNPTRDPLMSVSSEVRRSVQGGAAERVHTLWVGAQVDQQTVVRV
mmetsp:Transcript_2849/g.9652  ORF Transcript_2849/g.9652 Transcript_2849/m.9652 type:complete len:232 (-) Transcript_2849:1141-1836(-)|eukprot:scaffold4193_cov110-Isochrysis_galbana.AAC.6